MVVVVVVIAAFVRRFFFRLDHDDCVVDFESLGVFLDGIDVVHNIFQVGGIGGNDFTGGGIECVALRYGHLDGAAIAREVVVDGNFAAEDADGTAGVDDVFGANDGGHALWQNDFKMRGHGQFALGADDVAFKEFQGGIADNLFADRNFVEAGKGDGAIGHEAQGGAAVEQYKVHRGSGVCAEGQAGSGQAVARVERAEPNAIGGAGCLAIYGFDANSNGRPEWPNPGLAIK